MTGRLLLIAGNTLRAALDKRAIYLWGAAIVVMLFSAAPLLFVDGDEATVAGLRAVAVANALENLGRFCVAAVIFIGAGAVTSDIAAKTLITVLARPVSRWEIVVGKWLGLTAFGVITLIAGALFGIGVAAWAGVAIDAAALALALAHTAVALALFGAAAVALSAVTTSGLAGSLPVLLVFTPAIVAMLQSGGPGPGQTTGRVVAGLTPAGLEEQYTRVPRLPDDALRRRPALRRAHGSFDSAAQPSLFAENIAFAGIYLLAGCMFFGRRDVNV